MLGYCSVLFAGHDKIIDNIHFQLEWNLWLDKFDIDDLDANAMTNLVARFSKQNSGDTDKGTSSGVDVKVDGNIGECWASHVMDSDGR